MMTQEEQRIALAELEGWKKYGKPYPSFDTGEDVQWWKKNDACGECCDLPDYLNDLNAVHEVEKVLLKMESIFVSAYCEYLLCSRHPTGWSDSWPAIHATAAQRCEALCRTLWPERWEEKTKLIESDKPKSLWICSEDYLAPKCPGCKFCS